MLISLAWLRSLCRFELDGGETADILTSRGLTVDSVSPADGDTVLDVDVPPNRPDCLGHLGVARELSAALSVPLIESPDPVPTDGAPADGAITVHNDSPGWCGRYTATVVRGVRVGPSPDWVVRRLEACGLRSTNNAVDISNLVMLETGNPVHFFDLDRIPSACIRVRDAKPGERLTTLDGVERELEAGTPVIADAQNATAIAGVIGGGDSEIRDSTRDVLIEAAWFDPLVVRRTRRRLGIATDASFRFERGVDLEALDNVQALAVRWLHEIAGGTPAPGMIDVRTPPEPARELKLRPEALSRLLGFRPEDDVILESLRSLGLSPGPDGTSLHVRVPSWRVDLNREADLVEEVARHLGYDKIPVRVSTAIPAAATSQVERGIEESVQDRLAHRGFHESLGYSMIAEGEDSPFVSASASAAVPVTNPIADWLATLRRSLIPGLLRAVELNQRRGVRDVRLFETGRVFRPRADDPRPEERLRLGIAWSGAGEPQHWSRPARDVTVYDLIGLVEGLIEDLRPGLRPTLDDCVPAGYHPGLSTCWRTEAGCVARGGLLHPDHRGGCKHDVFAAEIELGLLASAPAGIPLSSGVPRLTALRRDLALVLTSATPFEAVLAALRSVEAPAPASFEVIDRYTGPPLADDEASLTVRVHIQPLEETLREAEIEGFRSALVTALESRLGVRIRS